MPERGPALVHDLGQTLRVEVLRRLAHDAHQLALPGGQPRRELFDEVQQVLLGLLLESGCARRAGHGGLGRYRAPDFVVLGPQVLFALAQAPAFVVGRQRARMAVTAHTVVLQRMAGIEHFLDRGDAMALFAAHHVLAREDHVIDDRVGVGPLAKQVVALEERVVPVAGMRDDQRLQRHRVLLHQIADAGVGVDHDLVGQAARALAIIVLVADELLAETPMRIADRQTHRGVGVQHLLAGDDLDLVGITIEAELADRDLADRGVVFGNEIEGPLAARRQRLAGRDRRVLARGRRRLGDHHGRLRVHQRPLAAGCLANRSRRTG